MSRSPSARRLLAGALTVALAGSVLTTATATSAQADDGPRTVHVKITKYSNVKMPDVIRPGVHRFVVTSTRDGGLHILKPRPGYTKREAVRDANNMFENPKVMRRFERNTTFVGGVWTEPGETAVAWMRIPRGRYWALDAAPNKLLARKVVTLSSAGEQLSGALPGNATVRAVDHVSWAGLPKQIPASGVLRFRNGSDANHFLGLSKLKRGKTMADFEEWVEQAKQGNETEPPVNFSAGFETGVIDPERAMSLRYQLPPGKYVMVCWWPDAAMGGAPHVFLDMYRGITLR